MLAARHDDKDCAKGLKTDESSGNYERTAIRKPHSRIVLIRKELPNLSLRSRP